MHWPKWFPYPSAWINAAILALLLGVITFAMRLVIDVGKAFVVSSDRPSTALTAITFFLALFLLIPIPVIAIVHHVIFIVMTQVTDNRCQNRNLFPGLMSWAEALRSWMVTNVSMLLTLMLFTLWLYCFDPEHDLLQVELQKEPIILALALIWFIFCACLYQVEYLANQQLLADSPGKVRPKGGGHK